MLEYMDPLPLWLLLAACDAFRPLENQKEAKEEQARMIIERERRSVKEQMRTKQVDASSTNSGGAALSMARVFRGHPV